MKYVNLRKLFYSFIISFVLVLVIVMFKSDRSFLSELEITLSIFSTALFIFLFLSFYFGLRIKKEALNLKLKFIEFNEIDSTSPDISFSDGLSGIVVSIILWIVAGIILSLLLSLFITIFWIAFVLFLTGFFWVFSRAVRIAFIKSRISKRNMGKSLAFSLFFTIIYVSWFYAVIEISKILS